MIFALLKCEMYFKKCILRETENFRDSIDALAKCQISKYICISTSAKLVVYVFINIFHKIII